MKAMRFMTNKARALAFLLGATGAVLTSIPMQAEAGDTTLLRSNGLTLKACRVGTRTLKFSGFYSGANRDGYLHGSVRLSSPSIRTTFLTQGRRVGDWRGGMVYLNSKYVTSRFGVTFFRVNFVKVFEKGGRTVYKGFSSKVPSLSISSLPRC